MPSDGPTCVSGRSPCLGCCAALGVSPQRGKKKIKVVKEAWKHFKHRQSVREIRRKIMLKKPTSGHSQEPGHGTDWAGLELC